MVNLRHLKTASERRTTLENELKIELPNIGLSQMTDAEGKNCENIIGALQIPVGIAGPLKITGQQAIGDFYVPFATTEGALVASINRGMKAISQSGGATTISNRVGITRAPVFRVKNLIEGQEFIKGVQEKFETLKKIAEKTSTHLTLLEIKPWQAGRNVFLRFRYDTQDAMGMNMATIATSAVVRHLEDTTSITCIALSGNMCVDKKPNVLNFIEGRGISTQAEVTISKETLSEVLKTNASELFEVFQRKVIYGSILSGSIGANAQAANVLAALFAATGQDVAHIAEASSVVTTVEELDNESIYISVSLPDLPVGTAGGGTNLPTQKEALSILGIQGGNNGLNAQKLAEVMAGSVLAGELSLLASLAENSLACAHETLGRGKTQ